MKKTTIILFAALLGGILGVKAQNASISPYSQYGLGEVSSQSSVANKGMGGIGQGWRDPKQVNFQNPASYSAIDSLTFLFDAGVSGQINTFKQGEEITNGRTASLDYVMALFRLAKHLGVSFGTMPYSNIGYSYYTTTSTYDLNNDRVNEDVQNDITYTGSGGFRQVYVGAGYQPFKYMSFGANFSYFFGNYTKGIYTTFGDGSTTDTKLYTATAKSWKIDAGIQLYMPIGNMNLFTLGGTYSFGHQVCNDAYCSKNSKSICTLSMPSSLAAGFAWNYKNKWRFGVDYSLMKFGSLEMPVYKDADQTYTMTAGQLKDRHSVSAGVDFCPNMTSRRWINRVHYRCGVGYVSPYIVVNGSDGPREINASLGVGLPIQNGYNNRSVLNIALQWANKDATGMIRENVFRLSIGLCFNEMWFAKWKAE